MISLLFALGPLTARELADHIGRIHREAKRLDKPELADWSPAENEVPSHLRALQNAVPPLATMIDGEWEAVLVVTKPKTSETQKGLFDDDEG